MEQALRQPVAERVEVQASELAEQQTLRPAAVVLAPPERGVAAGYWRSPEALPWDLPGLGTAA